MWLFFACKLVRRVDRDEFLINFPPAGIYDPALIGDKPKWYSNSLAAIPFKIIEETSTLGQAVTSFQVKSNDSEYTPTGKKRCADREDRSMELSSSDESGSDSEEEDEDNTNSCYSSLSDFVSEMRSSGICGEIRGPFPLLICWQ